MSVSQHGELFGQPRLLQRDADPLANLVRLAAPVVAQHFDLAGRGLEQAFEDFDRRRLASAVGAQQAEALALLDRQIESAHRLHRRLAVVSLHQIVAADGEHGRRLTAQCAGDSTVVGGYVGTSESRDNVA